MNQLLPIIQRQRRPLQKAILPETPTTTATCPHCGRRADEPASVPLDTAEPPPKPLEPDDVEKTASNQTP